MEHKKAIQPRLLDTIKTILIFLTFTVASLAFTYFLETPYFIFVSYTLATMLIARVTKGYFYGLFSCVVSVFVSFILNIEFTSIQSANSPLVFISFFISLLTISIMTSHLKQHAIRANQKKEKAKKLLEINERLLTTRGIHNIVELSLECISNFTERTVIFYEGDSQSNKNRMVKSYHDDHIRILNSYHETFIAHWVFEHGECAGIGTSNCSKSSAIYFPVIANDHNLGVFGIYCGDCQFLETDTITFLKLIIAQIAMAIERQNLSDNQKLLAIETEKEKMRSNLLRAVSHDLRTPLTCMIGASTILIENKESLTDKQKDTLLLQMKEDSNWLLHMVENLLSVTRIKEGSTAVTKTPEPLEEVVSEVITRIKNRYPQAKITVKVPEDLIMVPMDATLIEQVILNLIENAIKYSQSENPVELLVTKQECEIVFHVTDDGIGINEEEITTIFDGISIQKNPSADSTKGIGIGLSICKTIINAHGGAITAHNREQGGVMFTFTLPMEGAKDEH